ncbi:MAG: GTP-binding protein [Clostridia bacterium]|nr:GTP-binding protein [Clostridia bacterium]
MIVDIVNGFLGSGKTTLIKNLLDALGGLEKIAVIVNEFGAVGIDGTILAQDGMDVIELPSGCICCTLNSDLKKQVAVIATNYAPDRLIIEPTGVATISSLLKIFNSLTLEKFITQVRIICIVDATDFFNIYSGNKFFVESQLAAAQLVVINKVDLIADDEIDKIVKEIEDVNSQAYQLATAFGQVPLEIYLALQGFSPGLLGNELAEKLNSETNITHQFQTYCSTFEQQVSEERLGSFLKSLQLGEFGAVIRAKGILKLKEKDWVLFNLATGKITITKMEQPQSLGKIVVIGTNLTKKEIEVRFTQCLIGG